MARIFCLTVVVGATFLFLMGLQAFAQHGWPVEPVNTEHPIANSFGEFQDYSQVYKHKGIDILGDPKINDQGDIDPEAPWVRAPVGGYVTALENNPGTKHNLAEIKAGDTIYLYGHLKYNSFDPDFYFNYNNGNPVAASAKVAKIVRWPSLHGFHHLHYQLEKDGHYLNPLADISPNPDPDAPVISAISFVKDNTDPWDEFTTAAAHACPVVSGKVDIILQCTDRDNAGAEDVPAQTLWVYNVRWRACPEPLLDCPWQETHVFDKMPTDWGASDTSDIPNSAAPAYFSTSPDFVSSSDYDEVTDLFAVLTNFVNGVPDKAGHWDTTAIPDGPYTVSAEATDFAGNTTVFNTCVIVQNGSEIIPELTLRDAPDDTGAIPYLGIPFWESPDITANPGTEHEDHYIIIGETNLIEVQVWNFGSSDLPSGTSYEVGLAWALPSGFVPHPLPQSQVIGEKTEALSSGVWAPGTSRVTEFEWAPTEDEIPQGKHCLIAWVHMPEDPVLDTPSVRHDDNRAQQNITFQKATSSFWSAASRFWINPHPFFKKRSLEMTFQHSGRKPTIQWVKLHLDPRLTIEQVIGGHITLEEKPARTRPQGKVNQGFPRKPQKGPERKPTSRVIRGIHPAGRLRLEGIGLKGRGPVPLLVEVLPEEWVGRGSFVDIHIVEYAVLKGQEEMTAVGGLTLRFEH